MHEYLFVFFEPGIQRGPFEPDRAAEPGGRGVGEQQGGDGPVDLASPERVCCECAAPAVLAAVLGDHEVTAHVFERDVVLRVVGPFPYVQGMGGVEYLLAGQERADAPRDRFDVVGCGDHGRIVVHCQAPVAAGEVGHGWLLMASRSAVCMTRSATSAVQPVWWEAPAPRPVSPGKCSGKGSRSCQSGWVWNRPMSPKTGRRPRVSSRKIETRRLARSSATAVRVTLFPEPVGCSIRMSPP